MNSTVKLAAEALSACIHMHVELNQNVYACDFSVTIMFSFTELDIIFATVLFPVL